MKTARKKGFLLQKYFCNTSCGLTTYFYCYTEQSMTAKYSIDYSLMKARNMKFK